MRDNRTWWRIAYDVGVVMRDIALEQKVYAHADTPEESQVMYPDSLGFLEQLWANREGLA